VLIRRMWTFLLSRKIDAVHLDIHQFLTASVQSKSVHLLSSAARARQHTHIIEFGVASGQTINQLADFWPDQPIYGFDSFEGLPEDWQKASDWIRPKHTFATPLPVVRQNVQLVKGWFDTTLPQWLITHPGNVRFLHIDSDLYQSAKTVLTLLNDRIQRGTVIVFDELCWWSRLYAPDTTRRYENWAQHEWKALAEWMHEYKRTIKILSRNNSEAAGIIVVR